MYIYSFFITYTGNDPFIQKLWAIVTRGGNTWPMSQTLTPQQATALKNQATTAGFTISNVTRVPVPTPPEDVVL